MNDFGIFWICGKCKFVFQNTELPRSLDGLEGTNCVGISGIKTTLSRGVSASKSCLDPASVVLASGIRIIGKPANQSYVVYRKVLS